MRQQQKKGKTGLCNCGKGSGRRGVNNRKTGNPSREGGLLRSIPHAEKEGMSGGTEVNPGSQANQRKRPSYRSQGDHVWSGNLDC